MTIDEMLERKRELGYTYETIAERANLPLGTVQKVLGRITKSPRYETIQALERVLKPEDPAVFVGYGKEDGGKTFVREMAVSYRSVQDDLESSRSFYPLLPGKCQGEYTAEDRDCLPEDARTELIDGVLYDMAPPRPVHQILVGEIYAALRDCAAQAGRECLVFLAPSDVWLTGDDKNIFQPDLYVICDLGMIDREGMIKGAPPLVMEVLSPSTRSRDMLLKAYKYSIAGVREYWIIDPENRKVLVYDYVSEPDGTKYTEYSFSDTVPVRMSEGNCSVDFARITKVLERAHLM